MYIYIYIYTYIYTYIYIYHFYLRQRERNRSSPFFDWRQMRDDRLWLGATLLLDETKEMLLVHRCGQMDVRVHLKQTYGVE